MLLVVVLVLAILVLVNAFLAKHHYRMDFTSSKLHSLSEQSVKVVKALKNDIIIKAFFREGNYSRGSMENLMKIYAYESPKLKVEFIDPDKNPGLVKRYQVTQDGTTIFESGDKDSRITIRDRRRHHQRHHQDHAAKRRRRSTSSRDTARRRSRRAETTAIPRVKGELEKMGYEVKKLALALSENFPADCDLLVVPGPKKALLPNEVDTIKGYVGRGGRVFFMLDPETDPGLAPLLADYGLKIENDLIVDTVSRLLGGDYFMPVVSEYEYHDITKSFRYATFFPFARSIEPTDKKPDGATVTVIARTSPNSWSERQLDQKEVKFDKDKDKQGPISLAVVETLKVKGTETKDVPPADEARRREGGAIGRVRRLGLRRQQILQPLRKRKLLPQYRELADRGGRPHLHPAQDLLAEDDPAQSVPGPAPLLRLGHPPAARRPCPWDLRLAPQEVVVKFKNTIILFAVFLVLARRRPAFRIQRAQEPGKEGKRGQARGPGRGRHP